MLYISCRNCFPPLQGWLIGKLKGSELVRACTGMSGGFSDAVEHPLSRVDQLSQVNQLSQGDLLSRPGCQAVFVLVLSWQSSLVLTSPGCCFSP